MEEPLIPHPGQAPASVRFTARLAVVMVLSLIFIGGLVRATGAGLGCPDWPRCWGAWWPPAGAEEIALERINRDKIPVEFREAPDPRVFFNKEKMWIEYLNRLWGVVTGFAVIALFVASARHARRHPVVFSAAAAALVLILIQGWLGALVVRTGLHQGMITLHMALALAILFVLVFASQAARAGAEAARPGRTFLPVVTGVLALTIVQILLGTEVRSALDAAAKLDPPLPRGEWIQTVGLVDHAHRLLSWGVLLGAVWILRIAPWGWRRRATAVLALVILQLALGVSLAYLPLPPVSQFLHLGLAAMLAAALLRLALDARRVGRSRHSPTLSPSAP